MIDETHKFLQYAQNTIKPDQPTAIHTNFNRKLGLFGKQTAWSDMPSEEYEEIKFVTTTLVQLGKFYDNQTNGSLLGGKIKAFGWRKGFERGEHCGKFYCYFNIFSLF